MLDFMVSWTRLSVPWADPNHPDLRAGDGGGHKLHATWEETERLLLALKGRDASVELTICDAPEPGPQNLQVFGDGYDYMLMLGVVTEDDFEVLTFNNPTAGDGTVEIGPGVWAESEVCDDFDVVMACFREFYARGDVSREVLS